MDLLLVLLVIVDSHLSDNVAFTNSKSGFVMQTSYIDVVFKLAWFYVSFAGI